MTAQRCPDCLNLPISRALACDRCKGTGFFNPFPRPATVHKLSLTVGRGGFCSNCHQVQTVETYYPRNDPLTLVVRTYCGCSVSKTRQPFNPEVFYQKLFANNPNHPMNINKEINPCH